MPLDQTGVEMNMPSDRPGVLMQRMLLKMIEAEAAKAPPQAAE